MTFPGRHTPQGPRIDTAAYPPAEQVAQWESHTRTHVLGVRCHSATAGTLHAVQRNCAAGLMRFAELRVSPHAVERGAAEIAQEAAPQAVLLMLLEGEAMFGQDGHWVTVVPGDILALRSRAARPRA
ncbi:hypothetical protein [Mangrovicoccus ximenensis]|uniref:hypothetical protein n=1 Tax=Mangrovicoccus ximenensis TaxID=1911570 RepID=UPI000D37D3AB|nr:hypothetical protein [Mangrovicoccus ximenensis]